MKESEITEILKNLGARIFIGQKAENISDDIDLVVYTAAIHADNPEFVEVKRRNIPMLTRAQLLGQIMLNYKYGVAVSGTHGNLHALLCIAGGADRSNHLHRWYVGCDRRQYPRGALRLFRYRGL